jgi:hypothetical protein
MTVQLVLSNLAIESIPVNAENLRSLGLVAFGFRQCVLDEAFFKFAQGLVKVDLPLDHFRYKRFQLLFHNSFP